MSTRVGLLILVALIASCAQAKKKYDHLGKVEYHPPQQRDLLAGRTDLFYDGDYICTPGDEHHAPDCRKNWWVIDAEGYRKITLDDGTQFLVFDKETDSVFSLVPLDRGHPTVFRYRLGKTKKDWMKFQEIEIEGVGKGYYEPLDKTAPQDQHCLTLPPAKQSDCLAGR